VIAYWAGILARAPVLIRAFLAAATRYQVDPALVKAWCGARAAFFRTRAGRAGNWSHANPRRRRREWAAAEHISAFEHRACLDPATTPWPAPGI